MARRRRFHRTSPDRGWIVGQSGPGSITFDTTGDVKTRYFQLFDFADIDPEALTGRIEQDKSDWFVKRVLLNIALSCRLQGLDEGANVRWVEWAMGTASNENAEQMESSAGFPVIGPEVYNLWSRQFQSGVMPTYMQGVLPYRVDPTEGNTVVAVSTTGEAAGWLPTAPFWGPAFKTYDFEVSNAGLRNNQSCGLAISMVQGPHPQYSWDEADVLDYTWWYQILVQKRRT